MIELARRSFLTRLLALPALYFLNFVKLKEKPKALDDEFILVDGWILKKSDVKEEDAA